MKLQLTKPLAFIDLETTGVSVGSDRIVEISILKLFPNYNKELKTLRVNPTIPIPESSAVIHGIRDEDVKNEPTFKELAPQLLTFLEGCDLAGYNSNKFDIPLLVEEFLRAEVDFDISNRKMIDVQNIFHQMEQRTLSAAYKFYCGKDLVNAHSAEADTIATYEILEAQIERYNDLKNDMQFLHDFSMRTKNVDLAGRIVYNKEGVEIFSFGKHKDKPVCEVFKAEPSYYSWMMNGDFPLHTKKIITQLRLKTFNNK